MRFAPALAALVVLAALAGCSPVSTEPEPPPPGRGWAQPALAFESDSEALAAAETAFLAYVQVGESITHEGGKSPERLRPLVTADFYLSQQEVYSVYREREIRTTGSSVLLGTKMQTWNEHQIVIYACQDFSAVRVIDAGGSDSTPTDRPDIATFQVELEPVGMRLLVGDSQLWSHGTSCF